MLDPSAGRPYMPGYGTLGPEEGSGLLPWSWAADKLGVCHTYWLTTVWPDSRPHVTPVWGVWDTDSLWFSCSPQSRKTKNLDANPHASATTDDPHQPVTVDGLVDRIIDPSAARTFADRLNAKYGTDYKVDFFANNGLFRLRVRSAFGLTDADFTGSPTRWTFVPQV